MNKIILGGLFFLASISLLHGQIVRGFGVKAGACTATQVWNDHSYGYRWGIDLGGYVEWLDMPVVTILSEVHYIQKGLRYRFYRTPGPLPDETWNYDESTPRIDYLSFPILGKVRYGFGEAEAYFVAGPRIDLLLGQDGDGWPLFAQNGTTSIGATLGFGIQTRVASFLTWGLELRYSPSFTHDEIENFSVKNKSFEMLLSLAK